MKESVEIFIRPDGLEIHTPFKQETEFIPHPVTDLGRRVTRCCEDKNPSGLNVSFYLSEDLLFYKNFSLPLKTADIKEAVGYQLAILAPFEGKMLHRYTAIRGKQDYSISLYALLEEKVTPWLDEVAGQGFRLVGLFPESQRYVTRLCKKKRWSLLLPGRYTKLLIFSEHSILDRILCHSTPSAEQLQKLDPGEVIYTPSPDEGSGFQDSSALLAELPLHKEFNLLPASYRRPDYLRYVLVGLCILNLGAFLGVGAIKEYSILNQLKKTDGEISALQPQIKEVEQLRLEDKQLTESIERIEGIGQNFDIISFFEKATKALPKNSYLDQIRMDEKTGDIQLQGYTDDIGDLTSNLDALNKAKLKSTSRRKNQTYFHVEVSSK
ncbi:MAG: hypothetical protein V1706_02760 [Pseudomonadota bacterium]